MSKKRHPAGAPGGVGGQYAPDPQAKEVVTSNAISLQEQGASNGSKPKGYNGVPGALPPDKNEISWWRANEMHNRNDFVIAGPVRFADGRHGIVVGDESPGSPRYNSDDLSSGLGTIAIGGKLAHVGDTTEGGGRVDWWKYGRIFDDAEDNFKWMISEMNGEDISPYEWDYTDREPTQEEIWQAAKKYHDRTGDFAFPLYGRGIDHYGREVASLHLGKPDTEPPYGKPIGFMILSDEQAKTMRDDTDWDKAYDDLSYALDIYDSWREGEFTSAVCAVFTSDPDDNPDYMGTGFYRSEELDEVAKETLGEMAHYS